MEEYNQIYLWQRLNASDYPNMYTYFDHPRVRDQRHEI